MSTSQNGWEVFNLGTASELSIFPWVTGRVRRGDVFTVLNYLCREFNTTVEPIIKDESWGFAYRPIEGSTTFSNHASGTAIDLNAPKHPMGVKGTFSAKQVASIEKILSYLEGVVRWGGHYSGRVDDMHFEINVSPSDPALARVARKVSGAEEPSPVVPVPVDPAPVPSVDAAEIRKMVVEAVREVLLSSEMAELLMDAAETGSNRALWTPPMAGRKDAWGSSLKESIARSAHNSATILDALKARDSKTVDALRSAADTLS